jgi:hypothetical protein
MGQLSAAIPDAEQGGEFDWQGLESWDGFAAECLQVR